MYDFGGHYIIENDFQNQSDGLMGLLWVWNKNCFEAYNGISNSCTVYKKWDIVVSSLLNVV